jgi:lipid-A-disaccharide synthase
MRILISAGEASGDLYGSVLISELLRLAPATQISAIGGVAIKTQGVQMVGDSSTWGAISIIQSTREAPKVATTYFRAKREFSQGEPGVFVPIDFGYMNLRLCAEAKKRGWKVVYFIPPGSWRRDRQGRDLPALTDHIVTNFPWSADILNEMGATAHFFGHPLKQVYADVLGQSLVRSGIAVLPGSRRSEIEQLAPVMVEALETRPEVATIPVPSPFVKQTDSLWPRAGDLVIDGSKFGGVMGVLWRSKWGIIKSGTATLEAVLADLPMVAVYKVSPLVEFETKLVGFKRPRFVSQPNLLLEREIVPELIQEGLTVNHLRATMDALDTDVFVAAQREGFAEINEMLGASDSITKTAELILTCGIRH